MGEDKAGRLLRLATIGVIAWVLAETGRFLYLSLSLSPLHVAVWQAVATVVYLPLQFVLVLGAMRGARPRHSWWLLAGVALAIGLTLPFGGDYVALVLWGPAGLVLLYFRPPWSFVGFLAVVLATITAVLHTWGPGNPARFHVAVFDTMDVTWGGVALAVLVWLVRVIGELDGARQLLAARAVIAERRRIDDEVDRTVGAALARIIASGEKAAALVQARDRDAAAREMRVLTARSRAALADARGMLTGYRQVSAEAELRAVVTLLAAGGVRAHLALPAGGLPAELPDPFRARLRTLVADALSGQGSMGERALTITAADGRLAAEFSQPDPVARHGMS